MNQIQVFMLAIVVLGCFGQDSLVSQNEKVVDKDDEANAGTLRLIEDPIIGVINDDGVTYKDIATNNVAKSKFNVANAGTRTIFSDDTVIGFSDLNITNTASSNNAKSKRDLVVGGSQVVFSTIKPFSYVYENSETFDNFGQLRGGKTNTPDPSVISGSQTQLGELSESVFVQKNLAENNFADNDNEGDAIGGIATDLGSVDKSFVFEDNEALSNTAVAEDGNAVSGIQNNIDNVRDSRLILTGNSTLNSATSQNGDAVAGIENNFGTLQTTFPSGGIRVVNSGDAKNNTASAKGGNAVAGVSTNVAYLEGASVFLLDGEATNNTAVVQPGNSDSAVDAISGVSLTVNDAAFSNILVRSNSTGNVAKNYNQDDQGSLGNDAIAGTQVVVNSADYTTVNVKANSTDNEAYAVNGNAIAGNRVMILDSSDTVDVSLDLSASGNNATSVNGDAEIQSDVFVTGGATVVANY